MITFQKGYFARNAGAVYQDYESLTIGAITGVPRVLTITFGCSFSAGYFAHRG